MIVTNAKAAQAAEALTVDLEGLTEEAVNSAYRQASKSCHPDTDGHSPERWQQVSWAKEALLGWLESRAKALGEQPVPKGGCRACSGTGRVRTRGSFGPGVPMHCVLCNGTGGTEKD